MLTPSPTELTTLAFAGVAECILEMDYTGATGILEDYLCQRDRKARRQFILELNALGGPFQLDMYEGGEYFFERQGGEMVLGALKRAGFIFFEPEVWDDPSIGCPARTARSLLRHLRVSPLDLLLVGSLSELDELSSVELEPVNWNIVWAQSSDCTEDGAYRRVEFDEFTGLMLNLDDAEMMRSETGVLIEHAVLEARRPEWMSDCENRTIACICHNRTMHERVNVHVNPQGVVTLVL